jgi:adenylate kinase family enzyme
VSTRIAVVGTTCSGKTTLAKRLAERHGAPHIELDALHWGPGWSEPSDDEFRARVEAALTAEDWVADGAYHGKLGGLVLERADLVVWLDPPLPTILGRLGVRTLRRIRAGEELWGGNRETWRGAIFSRSSLLLWASRRTDHVDGDTSRPLRSTTPFGSGLPPKRRSGWRAA